MPVIQNSKQSSIVKRIDYDPDSRDLTVTLHGGKTYTYPNRSASDHNRFVSAESHGKHFATVVKHWPNK